MSRPSRQLLIALLASIALLGVAAAGPFLPLVQNGTSTAASPVTFRARAGTRLVGATPFVACAPDGTLRFSAFAVIDEKQDQFEGHTVFRADADGVLIEEKAYRSTGSRGSIVGVPLDRCGITGLASVNLPNDSTLRLIRGDTP